MFFSYDWKKEVCQTCWRNISTNMWTSRGSLCCRIYRFFRKTMTGENASLRKISHNTLTQFGVLNLFLSTTDIFCVLVSMYWNMICFGQLIIILVSVNKTQVLESNTYMLEKFLAGCVEDPAKFSRNKSRPVLIGLGVSAREGSSYFLN